MINQHKFTIPVYDSNPYLYELDSLILEIKDDLILLDETIFYPVGGGQSGDTGQLTLPNGEIVFVVDTFRAKEEADQIWLKLNKSIGKTWQGKVVNTVIDWDRRYRHMQMHTCMHLLCYLIDAPVTGCSIGEDKARLDFDLPNPTVNKEEITREINELIRKGFRVISKLISQDELNHSSNLKSKLTSLPTGHHNHIRLIEIENIDIQLCSGTHVRNTNEIQSVVCTKIKKVSKTNRRIEISWDKNFAEK